MLGTRTNIPFLIRLLELPAFRAGRLHTGMIEEHLSELTQADEVPPEALVAAAFATVPTCEPQATAAATSPTATPGRRSGAGGGSDMPSRTIMWTLATTTGSIRSK